MSPCTHYRNNFSTQIDYAFKVRLCLWNPGDLSASARYCLHILISIPYCSSANCDYYVLFCCLFPCVSKFLFSAIAGFPHYINVLTSRIKATSPSPRMVAPLIKLRCPVMYSAERFDNDLLLTNKIVNYQVLLPISLLYNYNCKIDQALLLLVL